MFKMFKKNKVESGVIKRDLAEDIRKAVEENRVCCITRLDDDGVTLSIDGKEYKYDTMEMVLIFYSLYNVYFKGVAEDE